MKIAKTIPEFLGYRAKLEGKSLAFIPTMGNLHSGHIGLMSLGRSYTDATISSIFVNPAQFAPHEDFDKYPRTFENDVKKLNDCGVSLLFAPINTKELYTKNHLTKIQMTSSKAAANPFRNEGNQYNWLDEQPESIRRPGFFDGVATVLTKLFNITRPNVVVFGQKDAIQCIVVKQLVQDLNFVDIKVLIGKTERESDGLAMSSRNQYLSTVDRKAFGPILNETLLKTQGKCDLGSLQNEKNIESIVEECYGELTERFKKAMAISKPQNPEKYEVEYVTMCDNETGRVLGTVLKEGENFGYRKGKNQLARVEEANISVVVRVNGTRLLDNIVVRRK